MMEDFSSVNFFNQDKTIILNELINELKKGELSAQQTGWLSEEEVNNYLKETFNI